MSEENSEDKSFDATPARKQRARREGQVALSTDLTALAGFVGLGIGLFASVSSVTHLGDGLASMLRYPEDLASLVLSGSGGGVTLNTPLSLVVTLIGPAMTLVIAVIILQGAVTFVPKKLKPDLKRIAPWEGVKRKYGAQGLAEFLRSGGKLLLVGIVGGMFLWARWEELAALAGMHSGRTLALLKGELFRMLLVALFVWGGVSLIDVPARRMALNKRLRMGRQEVVDEQKDSEGDPTQKQRRRERAQELSRNQMLRDTAGADVVIVNPVHYAVALRWDRSTDDVPVCVAKGVDHLARAIRDRARLSGVPVREDPPTARALHASVEVGQTIKVEHYAAVAAAIRFAQRVRTAT